MNAIPLTYTQLMPPMDDPDAGGWQAQNDQIQETVRRERGRLLDFIRRRLPDAEAAEDVLQDVFYELTEAYRLTRPIGRAAAWLFAVARNKIADWYRRPKAFSLNAPRANDTFSDDDVPMLMDFIGDDDSPETELFREAFLDALTAALGELPAEQRDVFWRHEMDGQSFNAMSAELGVPVNTLLSRKRYAVLHLRERLQDLYDDLTD
ncbi:RNA polymerase sigma factor [Spirosoma oryzae]|nr:sigma-70 family RNA polymerase sigma factor [Spirosoma oryzae]